MTACLILWWFPLCSQISSDLSRHGLKTSECPVVSGTRACHSGSSGSWMLGGRVSMDQTCSSTSYRCLIRLGSGELGGPVNALGHLLCSLSCSWAVFVVVLLWWGRVLGPQQCLDWFPSRASYCDEMISVIHTSFNVVADWCLHQRPLFMHEKNCWM